MQAFNDRQVGRMAMVGCTEQNRPIIEDSYRFVLDTLDRHVRAIPFLFGTRPSLADFGLFGQLQILSVDPTPMAEMRARAPDVYCWLLRLDDASGVDGDVARCRRCRCRRRLTALLKHCGETYLPFLAANTRALQRRAPTRSRSTSRAGPMPRRRSATRPSATTRCARSSRRWRPTCAGGSIRCSRRPAASPIWPDVPYRAVLFDVGGRSIWNSRCEMAVDGAIASACGMEGVRVDQAMIEEASDQAVEAFAADTYAHMIETLCGGDPRHDRARAPAGRGDDRQPRCVPAAAGDRRAAGTAAAAGTGARRHRHAVGAAGAGRDRRDFFTRGVPTLPADACIFVGDRLDKDIAPAKARGMATIRFRTGRYRRQTPAQRAPRRPMRRSPTWRSSKRRS